MLKLDLEDEININIHDIRLILEGKEWKDNDRLSQSNSGKTLYVSRRLRGGDPIGDIFRFIIKIFDFIISIFNGVVFLVMALVCGIVHIQNIWFCIFFDIFFIIFFVFYMIFYIVALFLDLLFDGSFCVNFLEGMWAIDYEGLIRKAFPKLNPFVDKIVSCFRC